MQMEDLRKQIDAIDDEIVQLYDQRMEICKQIGMLKAQSNMQVNVPAREKSIINRLSANVADDKKVYLKQLYGTMFSTSKAYQNQFSVKNSVIADKIRQAVAHSVAPVSANVACQGVEGSYSSIATDKMFALSNITYFKTFEGVFSAIDKGLCRYGVLPIENSNTGSILQVYDLMQKHRFYIVRSVRVQVKHTLCGIGGTDLSKIKTVISHQQGLLQCEQYLKSLGVATQVVDNTAVAARIVAESGDETLGAICSAESSAIYGLTVLQSNVQDNGNNYTRFICISKDMEIYKGADKISVVINAAHTPGSLNEVLSRFAVLNLNLTKLESRPILNSSFEFLFYFDFEGDVTDNRVLNLIADLENGTDGLVFLGSYKETV